MKYVCSNTQIIINRFQVLVLSVGVISKLGQKYFHMESCILSLSPGYKLMVVVDGGGK